MNWMQVEYRLAALCFGLLVLYHLILYFCIRRGPGWTSLGLAAHGRRLWVRAMIAGNKDILAVQTLRNWTMASTFLASTAILIATGALNLAATGRRPTEVLALMDRLASTDPVLWQAKLAVIGVDFLLAFFNFTLSIRYYNHVGLMINTPDEAGYINPESVADILDRGAWHYTFGMRAFYLAIPLALWLFGPVWLAGGTLFLLWALYTLDRGV